MQKPSASQAYAMIRVLKKRQAKGDPEKIAELEELILSKRDNRALLDIEKFFPTKK